MIKQQNVITSLSSLADDDTFQNRNKKAGSFVRNRKLSFQTIVGMILPHGEEQYPNCV